MNDKLNAAGKIVGKTIGLTVIAGAMITAPLLVGSGMIANDSASKKKERQILPIESFNTASMIDTDCVYVDPRWQRKISFHATDSGEIKKLFKSVANAASIGELTKYNEIYEARLPKYRMANTDLTGDSCIDLEEHQKESGAHDIAVKLRSLTMENGEASYIKIETVEIPKFRPVTWGTPVAP